MKGHRRTKSHVVTPSHQPTNHTTTTTTTTPSRSLLDLVSYVSRSLHIVSIPYCNDNGHYSGQILNAAHGQSVSLFYNKYWMIVKERRVFLSADGNSGVVVNNILAVLTDLVPVDHVPPVADVLGPAVLVLEVVGMLPNVKAEDGEHDLIKDALHERIVLVGRADQLELVAGLVDADPDPASSEEGARSGTSLEFLLHLIHGAEGLVDELLQLGRGLRLGGLVGGGHLIPEEGVVVVSATAVTNARSGLEGVGHQVEDGDLILPLGGFIDVCNVRGMVLVMMDLHGGSVATKSRVGVEK